MLKTFSKEHFVWPNLGTDPRIGFSSVGDVSYFFFRCSPYPFKGFVFLNQNEKWPTSLPSLVVFPIATSGTYRQCSHWLSMQPKSAGLTCVKVGSSSLRWKVWNKNALSLKPLILHVIWFFLTQLSILSVSCPPHLWLASGTSSSCTLWSWFSCSSKLSRGFQPIS